MPGVRWLFAALLVFATAAERASALDLGRRLTQLHHTSWTMESGAPPDVWALAQSPDGYLWLGTGAGLFRFDGVRFEKLDLPYGQRLPSTNITALLADHSGDIWIGFVNGAIARLRDGQLATFTGLPNDSIYQIAVDRGGTYWAALHGFQKPGLARFDGRRWQMVGREWGLPKGSAISVIAARDGAVWVNLDGELYVRRRLAARFTDTGVRLRPISCITEAPDGGIWVSSDRSGRPRQVEGPGSSLRQQLDPPPAAEHETGRMIVDRDGALWGTYQTGGLYRANLVQRSASDHGERFSLADGLSSDIARPLLEDREGNIWVGTNLGLDRFRATNIVSADYIPSTSRRGYYVAAADNGNVFVTATDRLFTIPDGQTPIVVTHLDTAPTAMHADRSSSVWIGTEHGLLHLENGRLVAARLPGPPGAEVDAIVQTPGNIICASLLHVGIACLADGRWTLSRFRFDAAHAAPLLMVEAGRGGLWLDYEDALGLAEGGRLRRFTARDGLKVGTIAIVSDSASGALVAGDFGLARFDGTRFATLDSERHPEFSRISGIVQSQSGKTWLNGIKGVVRIADEDLARAFQHPTLPIRLSLFDVRDGLPGVAQQDSDTPTAVEARDGKLWFVTSHGVAWLDPMHLTRNPVPPPVSIRAVIVNGKSYAYPKSLQLPGGSSNVEIDYTALSLSIPERVRFRYRLVGIDDDWVDPGVRREAFYTKLGPGNYSFRVIAANNDGVWNRTGATVDFTIAPTFVQSIWFKLLLVAVALPAAWLLYSLRVRFLTDQLRGRLEERLGERERIARELHDTLLQGFQGLVFRFQAASERLARDNPAREMISRALDQADEVLVEGRNRVMGLRADATLATIADRIAASARRVLDGQATEFRVIVEGKPKPLHPVVEEEAVRIVDEVLANAARHSRADCIEVSVVYHPAEFRLHVRDNGVGIDPTILAAGGRGNHFGLLGMRERASRVGASLVISSQPGAGTEVSLSVPGAAAFARARRKRRGLFGTHQPVEV